MALDANYCDRISHDQSTCLKPCTRVLACGHKCSGVCTDPCRCCEDCEHFKTLKAEQQMAQLQLEAAPSSWAIPSAAPDPIRDSNQAEWAEFSKNPTIHDDAIREALLQETSPFIPMDDAAPPDAVETGRIKQVFTPVTEGRDGARVTGPPQTSFIRGYYQRSPQPNTQTVGHGANKQKQNPQPRNQARAASGNTRSQVTPASAQPKQVPVAPSPRRNKRRPARREQEQNFPTQRSPAAEPLDVFRPVAQGSGVRRAPSEATADLMSLMGESDLGFDAEVLGVPRRRRNAPSPADTKLSPQKVQQMGHDVESMISFGGDGACSPYPKERSHSPKAEDKEELLVDI